MQPGVLVLIIVTNFSFRKLTRPGRIIPGPLLPREQTAHIKPFLISNTKPPVKVAHSDPVSPSESPSKKEAEVNDFRCQRSKLLISGQIISVPKALHSAMQADAKSDG